MSRDIFPGYGGPHLPDEREFYEVVRFFFIGIGTAEHDLLVRFAVVEMDNIQKNDTSSSNGADHIYKEIMMVNRRRYHVWCYKFASFQPISMILNLRSCPTKVLARIALRISFGSLRNYWHWKTFLNPPSPPVRYVSQYTSSYT